MSTSATQPPQSKIEDETSSVLSTLSQWKKLLVTKEDHGHHHKILGILCLLSFAYRFSQIRDDMAFATHPGWTIPTLAIHWMLTASSFQFKIPQRRIRDGGRIWPQYRWHAFSFTTRSILFLALYWYEQHNGLEPLHDLNLLIILLGLAGPDLANYAVGADFRSNTIREVEGPAPIKFIFSVMQFNATAAQLIGRSCMVPFYAMFTVQLTPFVGTLRRKGILKSNFWGSFLYASFLVGGFVVQTLQYTQAGGERMHLFGRSIGLLAAFLRLTPLLPSFCWPIQNKYVIWTLMYMIIRNVRPVISELDVVKMRMIVAALLASLAVSCYVKIKSGHYPADVVAAKKMASKAD
jgi:hypothetical protein